MSINGCSGFFELRRRRSGETCLWAYRIVLAVLGVVWSSIAVAK